MRLRANHFGRAKARRFRQRFNLGVFVGVDPEYADVHDYLHTVLGALPGPWEDELRVLDLEAKILAGEITVRGLTKENLHE